ncbi:nitrogenase [Clostridium estertheticum]|uniref:Nitrogenase n=1 Tax=Clostridium estertheticum TaxID=238834 RepID=A0AA47EKQ1_9CLOT|nr:nitrogenase component 1 [Clostridium estertheticum]MBU3154543.1 nitrogenase [Clostridium estertheticum]MBU3201243.1 nitrogenase [Clostridium estertheticum]WAG62023.1 nitrogenase [Clostridium estertheticum]WAG63853.1 nitrogenase [Clostridium estertheticum]
MGKINLEDPAVTIREARLGSITGFNGTAGELVKCAHAGKLHDCSRSFSQCLDCTSGKAFCQLSMIKDAAIVNHAPIGCAGDFFGYNFVYRVGQMQRGLPSTIGRYFNTNLEERDTVFGAVGKLKSTVHKVYDRVHPKAIFITTSCASGIIGDDVEGAANELTEELGIPVVTCFCEGFKSKIWTTGFDAAYHSIVRKIVKPPRKKTNKVNIINFWGEHIFDEMLEKLGYKAEYIVPFTTISQLKYISEASATIEICPTLGTYLGAALEQVYGVPEMKSPPGYGIAGTDTWMRELGTVLNRKDEIEEIIKEEHKRIIPIIEEYRSIFKGKTAYLTAGAAHGHAIIALLRELGFEVQGAAIFHHDPVYDNGESTSDALAQDVKNYGDVKNYNVCNKQAYELVNILNRLKPDIMIARHGGMTLWGAKLGVPTLLIGDEQFGFGYQGVLNYAERIVETLDNKEFVTNLAKHSTMPYTKWWLEQDPFTFLGGNTNVELY